MWFLFNLITLHLFIFFITGEIFELKAELNSDKKEKKKEAVKKVIASMTVGKDVRWVCGKMMPELSVTHRFSFEDTGHMLLSSSLSALFPDVVNCMQTDNLELKKLVYLYLMNYAKSQPDMAIMAVNTFVKVKLSCLYVKTEWYYSFVIECRNQHSLSLQEFSEVLGKGNLHVTVKIWTRY